MPITIQLGFKPRAKPQPANRTRPHSRAAWKELMKSVMYIDENETGL